MCIQQTLVYHLVNTNVRFFFSLLKWLFVISIEAELEVITYLFMNYENYGFQKRVKKWGKSTKWMLRCGYCLLLNQMAHLVHRGHLQTMWTVFWVFLTPPPPLWTNMDILGTPLPVHEDFSMTPPPLPALFPKKFSKYQFIGNLKSKLTTSYLWNI